MAYFFSRTFIFQFYSLICSDIVLFFSFVFSHPLYFSYVIFFSPHILKFVYFHSPLVITSSLLLLVLIYDNFACKLYEPGSSFLLSTMNAVLDRLSPLSFEDYDDFEQFEVYKYLFLFDKTSRFYVLECSIEVSEPKYEEKYCLEDIDQVLVLNSSVSTATPYDEVAETTKLSVMEEKDVHSLENKYDKVVEVKKEMSNFRDRSHSNEDKCTKNVPLCTQLQNKIVKRDATSEAGGNVSDFKSLSLKNLGSYGSMRNEKEWKRSLACKLYEERHNVVEGDEGMDSLWETYESDPIKSKGKGDKVKKKKQEKISEVDYCYDSEDEVEMRNGHLCCLQALKFSARKMNPSVVKISKVLRRVGWLRNVKRQSKINHHSL